MCGYIPELEIPLSHDIIFWGREGDKENQYKGLIIKNEFKLDACFSYTESTITVKF